MEQVQTHNENAKTFSRRDIHQHVTDIIMEQLEADTAPWHKPWTGGDPTPFRLPVNSKTGKAYQGINILLLWGASLNGEYNSHEWGSFKQWNEKKEAIRKGEKGSVIVYYDTFEKEVDGQIEKIPFLKSSVVFNRCQLASYDPENIIVPETKPLVERLEHVETFVANTGAIIRHKGNKAMYRPSTDEIHMPPMKRFVDTEFATATEHYYAVMGHELIHMTGSEKRLNRKFGKRFADHDYAVEELVAELGAAFLCAELEITNVPKQNHAAYLANWLGVLKENKYAIISAASYASKAVDYLHWLQPNQ